MRNSTLENWGAKRHARFQARPRAQKPRFSSQFAVTSYEQLPEGFLTLDDFLENEIDAALSKELPEARRHLAIIRKQSPNFVERLSDIRLEAGISQTDLAAKIGSSQPRLSLWEAGKEKPSFECISKLKKELNVDYNRIMAALENV